MKHYFYLISMIFVVGSCGDSNHRCRNNYQRYKQEWRYVIKRVEAISNGRSDYRIETTSGIFISFKPFQNIIAIANPGDRIIKLENTNWCYIVTPKGDTSTSRVCSPTCDSIITIWGRNKL